MGALRGAGCAGARAGCAILRHRAPAGSRSARFGRPPRGDTPQRYPVGRPPFRNRGRPSGPPLPTRHSRSPQRRTTSREHTGKQSPCGHPSPHSLAERPASPRRCAVEGTDRAAFHRHAAGNARNPHRRRRALPGCARRHRQQRAMHHPFEKQSRPCARRSHLHRLPQTRAHAPRPRRRAHRPRLERRQSGDAKRRGHHPAQTHLRVAAIGRRENGRH